MAFTTKKIDMDLPYHQIPEYPEDFSSGNIVSRMIDGLGYRYYWVTDSLSENDLKYKPSESGKSTFETLVHIRWLSKTILNATKNAPNIRSGNPRELSFEELRKETLMNLKAASEEIRGKSAEELSALSIIFQRGETTSEFPFWNLINGQIADALYHTGQVVSFRRSSGNPINPKVNVFIGKTGI
jgi:hypothetical protein